MPLQNIGCKTNGRQPTLPDGMRIYAVGDIHGRLDLLDALLTRVEADIARHPIVRPVTVFLGDYIDRGPSSRETVDRLIEHDARFESVFLKGNHEVIALNCLSDRNSFDHWLRLGGLETLISYNLAPELIQDRKRIAETQLAFHNAIPQRHFRFFRSMSASFTCGDFFFAHAGVRPGIELSSQVEADLLWIRNEFLSSSSDFGKVVVHGHTPTKRVDIRSNRINIDTGAFGTGCLTSLVLEGEALWTIDTLQKPD